MAGVIVEIQRQIDRSKLLTWPVYVTTLRAKLDCSTVLLVVAPDPEVAVWARRPIELGHPGFRLMPVVIGFDDVPWVRDRTEASRLPELAVLSAMAHPPSSRSPRSRSTRSRSCRQRRASYTWTSS